MEITSTLAVHQLWKGLKVGFRLTRERTIRGQTTVEVAYGITSLSDARGTAQALLGFTREHWGIENGLHWVRDETLREDACRVRSGSAPQVLAALRNSVITQLAQVDAASHREAREQMQLHPDDARRLIGIAQGD